MHWPKVKTDLKCWTLKPLQKWKSSGLFWLCLIHGAPFLRCKQRGKGGIPVLQTWAATALQLHSELHILFFILKLKREVFVHSFCLYVETEAKSILIHTQECVSVQSSKEKHWRDWIKYLVDLSRFPVLVLTLLMDNTALYSECPTLILSTCKV